MVEPVTDAIGLARSRVQGLGAKGARDLVEQSTVVDAQQMNVDAPPPARLRLDRLSKAHNQRLRLVECMPREERFDQGGETAELCESDPARAVLAQRCGWSGRRFMLEG